MLEQGTCTTLKLFVWIVIKKPLKSYFTTHLIECFTTTPRACNVVICQKLQAKPIGNVTLQDSMD